MADQQAENEAKLELLMEANHDIREAFTWEQEEQYAKARKQSQFKF